MRVQVGAEYVGTGGRIFARIVRLLPGDMVEMERWKKNGKRRTVFTLREEFLLGKSCGWRPVKP